ncbi:hypothetical protein DFH06DRAFT_1325706 [Mycena polygramma]|nr:hypothetical protein DFH06DRAFT_1325706 [Mycena polygramma]
MAAMKATYCLLFRPAFKKRWIGWSLLNVHQLILMCFSGMQLTPSPTWDPLAVPFDVWTSIFARVLEPHKPTVTTFITLQRKLCSVCSYWTSIVRGNAAFWTIVYVTKTTSEEHLRTSLSLSGTLPLDAVARLEAEALIEPRLFWDLIMPALPRCRTLVIHALDVTQLDPMRVAFQRITFNGIRSLTICTDKMSICNPRDSWASLRLSGPISDVSALQLRGISFDWTSRPLFPVLSTLVLVDSVAPPTWDDMRSLAANAPALQFFCLRNVGIYGIPAGNQELITFPSVVELDCTFGEYAPSVTLVLRYSRMPSLTVLRFHAREPGHVMCLAFCSTVLSTVKTLVISGVPDRAFSYLLFIRLPLLEELDIISNGGALLDGLLEADQRLSRILTPFGPCCPLLSRLYLSEPSATEIWEFLACRDIYAPTVKEVIFRESFTCFPTADDLAKLQDRVAIGFTGAYTDPPWISHV